MSSTNRGYERHKSDYYVTPHQPIREMLSVFLVEEKIDIPDKLLWLDPCAGGDIINEMSYPAVLEQEFGVVPTTIDEREDSRAEIKQKYEQVELGFAPDIIITNPPFYSALEIIKKALQDVTEDGYVIMLLRLNFWGSKTRRPFFEKNMPTYCYIHPRRMSFTPDGKTDSIEYAHFVWIKNKNPLFCKTSLL